MIISKIFHALHLFERMAKDLSEIWFGFRAFEILN
jgi:hypothetical protein